MKSYDATQIRVSHECWATYAKSFDGLLPSPGLVERLPIDGVRIPGRGAEDISQNTTANLFSLHSAQNYFSPDMSVGPTEPNPVVTVFDAYNYQAYSPATGKAWDPNFKADLQTGSNVSYAHMPLYGLLKDKYWRDTFSGSSAIPILGNRGPHNGVSDPKSWTLKIHEPHDQWSGNICFADGHVEFLVGLPTAKTSDGRTISTQVIFKTDRPDDPDGVLTFMKEMKPDGPVIQHD